MLRASAAADGAVRKTEGVRPMARQQARAALRLFAALAPVAMALIAMAAARPAFALAAGPLAPAPYIEDAPFTRNPVVTLTIQPDWTYASPAVDWRASNSSTTSGGQLVDGATVPGGLGDWTLAGGADGLRTVYVQTRHADGAWSPVASVSVTLDSSPGSRFVLDHDPWTDLPADADLHTQAATPGDRIFGSGTQVSGQNRGFAVGTDKWGVTFIRATGPAAPGTWTAEDSQRGGPCATVCVQVTHAFTLGVRCPGTFTIDAVSFTPAGDLETLDADFRLTCGSHLVIAGSIRYGSSRAVVAIEQSKDRVDFGEVDLGDPPTTQSVTLSNAGTIADTLGTATIAGTAAGDFDITSDGCSGTTLDPGESCSIAVELDPSTRGGRPAEMTLTDGTARGSRRIGLLGWAYQPVTLAVAATDLPEFGPDDATIVVTAVGGANLGAILFVDGTQQFQPVITNKTGPVRTEAAYTVALGPGTHTLQGVFYGDGYYLPGTSPDVEVSVGTATDLLLTTVTDDGVATGESAELIARLTTGGPVTGNLRIRNGTTGSIIASAAVSGDDPSLTQAVTRGEGTSHFTAEFVPGSPSIEPASDGYDLVVVTGTRPETAMGSSPLLTWWPDVVSSFSSATPGATFECRVNLANWWPCTSPWKFQHGLPDTVTLRVRAVLANGLADRTPSTRAWTYDPNLTGTVEIDEDDPYTTKATVTLSTPAPSGVPGVTQIALSNDGATWTTRAYAATQPWTLQAGSGTRKIWTRWRAGSGPWSQATSDTIIVDATDPSATAPKATILAGTVLSTDGKVQMKLTWSGSDATSGIARFDIERKVGSGAWGSRVNAATATSTVALSSGRTYRFRVRAIDKAGNVGAWTYGPSFVLTRFSELAGTYTGTWSTATAAAYIGDKAKTSSAAGSKVRFTFTGRGFGWIAMKGPTSGEARIYVNGVFQATVDLNSLSTKAAYIGWSRTWSSVATRTIEIRVVGTAGHSRVDVDGIWTLR